MRTRTRMLIERLVVYILILAVLGGDGFGVYKYLKERQSIIERGRKTEEEEQKLIAKEKKKYFDIKAELPKYKEKLKQKERRDEIAKRKWLKRKEEFEKYLKIIPPYNKKPELIKIINDFAKRFNVLIKDLTTSEVQTTGVAGTIKKFSFSMKLEGYYENVKKMLWYIENMPIIVQMEKGGFDFVNLNTEDGKFVVATRLFTYFFAR